LEDVKVRAERDRDAASALAASWKGKARDATLEVDNLEYRASELSKVGELDGVIRHVRQ